MKDIAPNIKKHKVLIRRKKATEEDKERLEKANSMLLSLKKQREVINDIIKGRSRYGQGLRKQPKRNAYKIRNNQYGGLVVDVPKLLNNMLLDFYQNGKKIYENNVDKSLIDLITKRFNPKKAYSPKAIQLFNDLNILSKMPKHRSSGKSKLVGGYNVYYTHNDDSTND